MFTIALPSGKRKRDRFECRELKPQRCCQVALVKSKWDPAVKEVGTLEFSPDDRYLLFGNVGQPDRLRWELDRRRKIRVPWNIGNHCWWGSSHELMIRFEDSRLGWWNPTTGETEMTSCMLDGRFDHSMLSPDGRFVASQPFPVAPITRYGIASSPDFQEGALLSLLRRARGTDLDDSTRLDLPALFLL
jgi:hypothetical protein